MPGEFRREQLPYGISISCLSGSFAGSQPQRRSLIRFETLWACIGILRVALVILFDACEDP